MGNLKYSLRWDFLTFCGDEERDAYFLGFFHADGNNSDATSSISLGLQQEDKALLDRLSGAIFETYRPLSEKEYITPGGKPRKSYTLYIGHRGISKRLSELGAPPRKTYTCKFPTQLTIEQKRHFIRGYFDGDGCCAETLGKKRTVKTRTIIICGHETYLQDMSKVIYDATGLTSIIRPAKGIHHLRIGGNRRALQFLQWIYRGANYFLQRKLDRYISLEKDLLDRDAERDYIQFIKKRNRWQGRLPAKYGRKVTGMGKTYEEAVKRRNEALEFLTTHTVEEWVKRPRKRWKKHSQETLDKAQSLIQNGASIKDAAIQVGMQYNTLQKRLQEDCNLRKMAERSGPAPQPVLTDPIV